MRYTISSTPMLMLTLILAITTTIAAPILLPLPAPTYTPASTSTPAPADIPLLLPRTLLIIGNPHKPVPGWLYVPTPYSLLPTLPP